MNNYLTLTKVLLKTTLSSISEKDKKKQRWVYVLLFLCLLPSLGAFAFMFKSMIDMMLPFNQVGYVYSMGLNSASIMILLFSTFLIPSVYYFSKDLHHLLPLPLSSECIIASKLTVCIVYEYLFCAMILIPLFIAFALCGFTDIIFWIMNLIVFITLPIYPLIIGSIVIVMIMRFVPMVRRKDLFNMIGSLLTVVICLSFSFLSVGLEEMEGSQLVALLMNGNNSLLGIFNYLFPHVTFISKGLFHNSFVDMLLYFVVLLIAIIIFLVISKAFYLKGALSIEETNSKRTKLSYKQLDKETKKENILISYTIKELKLLIRTPAYAMNCVITEFIFPVVIVIGIISGGGKEIIDLVRVVVPEIEHLFAYLLLIGLGVGVMASNTSMVSATSISREGSGYIFMKYIPVPLRTILNAKVLSGFIIAQIMIFFVYAGLLFLMPQSVLELLLSFIAAEVGALLGSYIGLIIDVIHPNLFWEDETSAVKRSTSGMISMFLGFGVIALLTIACFVVSSSYINIMAIISVIVCLIACVCFYYRIGDLLNNRFNKL